MDIQKIAAELSGERNRLDRAIAALEGLSQPARRRGRPPKAKQARAASGGKHGGITPAGRKRLSEMMKKRWAERKKKATRKRPAMSAAARKKLSALMKARWAGRKTAQSKGMTTASTSNEITANEMADEASVNRKTFRQKLREAKLPWYVRYEPWTVPRNSKKHADMKRVLNRLRSN